MNFDPPKEKKRIAHHSTAQEQHFLVGVGLASKCGPQCRVILILQSIVIITPGYQLHSTFSMSQIDASLIEQCSMKWDI